MNVHALEQLVDSTLPGCCPAEPESTWLVDTVGHIEATGVFAETLDHNRDLAKGVLDAEHGFVSIEENLDSQQYVDDMMRFARQGGERVYDQEQGFAPLILTPGFEFDVEAGKWRANEDAKAAAMLEQLSPTTNLHMPEMVQSRRHWRDVGPEEQQAKLIALDAETHGLYDPDALVLAVNDRDAMAEGGIAPTYALDGVDLERGIEEIDDNQRFVHRVSLLRRELLGLPVVSMLDTLAEPTAAPDYADHLKEMARHQAQDALRERDHAREAERRHLLTTHGQPVRCRRTMPAAPTYRERTHRWATASKQRKAALLARAALPEPEGLLPGRLEIPTDKRWLAKYGPLIRQCIADWYPTLVPGSAEWRDAAQRVYFSLRRESRDPSELPQLGPLPPVTPRRIGGVAVAPRMEKLPPSECGCERNERCPIHRAALVPPPSAAARFRERYRGVGVPPVGWTPMRVEQRTPEQAREDRLVRENQRAILQEIADVPCVEDDVPSFA